MLRGMAVALLLVFAGCASPEPSAEVAPEPPAEEASPDNHTLTWRDLPAGIHEVVLHVDGQETQGRLGVPDETPGSAVVLAKGLHGSVEQMDPFLTALIGMGHAGLAVEYRGPPDTWKVGTGARDVAAAAARLGEAFPDARIVGFGFSMGAQITAMAAAHAGPDTFDHLVLAGGVADMASLWQTQATWRPLFEEETGGRPSEVRAQYQARSPADHIDALAAADVTRVHLMHAAADTLIPSWHSETLYQSLRRADVGVSYHEVLGNRDAWVCTPLIVACPGAAPIGPANHEASIIGPIGTLLVEVVEGVWDHTEGAHRFAVDGVTGIRISVG